MCWGVEITMHEKGCSHVGGRLQLLCFKSRESLVVTSGEAAAVEPARQRM